MQFIHKLRKKTSHLYTNTKQKLFLSGDNGTFDRASLRDSLHYNYKS